MSTQYILPLADQRASLAVVGGKGASLARLSRAGLPVPDGFYVTTAAYERFVADNNLFSRIMAVLGFAEASSTESLETASQSIGSLFMQSPVPPEIVAEITGAYAALAGDEPAVAVRSSATAEDLPDLSFAGQQDTFLNVQGADAVVEAVKRCWASLWTARAIGYRMRHGIEQERISLAVVVQLLVPAEAAGILFTVNPVTGQREQAMVSAAWGLGEAVVGGLVTPDTLTVEKTTGRVLSRDTADKEVMTVRVNGSTEEQTVPDNLRRAPVLDDRTAAELVQFGTQIETLYEQPMDIEWTLTGGQIHIVQARPITALPEPEATPPIDWSLPDPKGRYMRASIVDLLPDPLSPLFSTMGLSAIDGGIGTMSEDLFNLPQDIFSGLMMTINGYAYEQVSFTGRQWWLMLTRMVPRMLGMLRKGVAYWRNVAHPRYTETVRRWEGRSMHDLETGELLDGIHEVLETFAHHLGSLMASTMGPSAGSEALFTQVYEKMVRRGDGPSAPTFLMGFDSAPIRGEKALYDLALWCREHEGLAAYLSTTPADQLIERMKREDPPDGVTDAGWAEWRRRFRDYLDRHGYSIYDMDFMKPLPMDRPGPMLENLKMFIGGQGADPYERQQDYAGRRQQAVETARSRVKGIKRWAFEKTLKWAQSQAPLREDGIAEIGLGYPLLHRMLRELGRRFVQGGMIAQDDDIFWLEQAEVEQAVAMLERGEPLPDRTEAVGQRRALWRARKQVSPPPQLPMGKSKYIGFDVDLFLQAGEDSQAGNVLKGVATSPGRVTATARVLRGPEDFGQMRPGDILVAGITTPAWTPLFAMASAVVTDIGGPLSHGSIVAREYGIPAVLGTGVATKRIHSGQIITVDGSTGEIILSDDGTR
jgi:phosphohistidine swiveling domain-containing protein